jgi:signal transduction histidine kinase
VSLSLRTRLTLSYMFVALLCILLVSALANGVLEGQFRRYVRETRESRNRQLAQLIGAQLHPGGAWDEAGLAAVGLNALEQGVIVRVSDPAGRTVWDAAEHNSGLCRQMIAHIAANMASRYPNWQGAYTEASYPLLADFREVGRMSVGTYGPFFLNDEDLAFLNALNRLLLWVTLAALALAVGVGLLMARGISGPLARVVSATEAIAAGNLRVRIPERTRVREIDRISASVNGLARALEAQEALRRRLTADVAHELRTPLATLQSHLEALIDGVWAPDRGRLAGLHEEILRIHRMVADLEHLARCENGARPLERRVTDLGELVRSVARRHEPQFQARGVDLRVEADGGRPIRAAVDADKVSQVLINLLSNALKFTPPGGAVEVRLQEAAGGVEMRVRDTGCGIRAEDLPLIFERFYRADPSRSRSTGGSGIGLTIAQAIVEAHGGTIRAASEPSRGSEFTVHLPRGPREA